MKKQHFLPIGVTKNLLTFFKMFDVWVIYKTSISMMEPLFFHQNTELWIWGDRSRVDLPEHI